MFIEINNEKITHLVVLTQNIILKMRVLINIKILDVYKYKKHTRGI